MDSRTGCTHNNGKCCSLPLLRGTIFLSLISGMAMVSVFMPPKEQYQMFVGGRCLSFSIKKRPPKKLSTLKQMLAETLEFVHAYFEVEFLLDLTTVINHSLLAWLCSARPDAGNSAQGCLQRLQRWSAGRGCCRPQTGDEGGIAFLLDCSSVGQVQVIEQCWPSTGYRAVLAKYRL